jgi:hypothetical protein
MSAKRENSTAPWYLDQPAGDDQLEDSRWAASDPEYAWRAHAQYWPHPDNEGGASELLEEFISHRKNAGSIDYEEGEPTDQVAIAVLVVGRGIVDALRSISFALRANGQAGGGSGA